MVTQSINFEANDIRPPCPPQSCDCGYYEIFADSDKTRISYISTNIKGLTITKIQEKNLLTAIHDVTTTEEFTALRNIMHTRHGIMFLINGKGAISMEKMLGLCKRTRIKVREALNRVLQEDKSLFLTILTRDSLCPDE